MKKIILPILLVVVLAGGYFAYTKGLIPGLQSPEQKAAAELKADIEAMKGPAFAAKYKQLMMSFFDVESMIPEGPQRDQFNAEMDKALGQMDLSYKSLDTSTAPGKAIVTLHDVVVKVDNSKGMTEEQKQAMQQMGANPFMSALAGGVAEQTMSKVTVIQYTDAPNHYGLDTSGESALYMGEGSAKTKLIGTKSEVAYMEVKLDANKKLTFLNSKSKNSEIIEGRGNTTLVKFGDGELSYEAKTPEAGKEVSSKYKFSINNIEFGDMIKMMLGQIEPISISADFDYTGHDLFELIKKAQNPAEKDKINQVAGAIILNDFYIKMGQSGLLAKGDFNFDAKKPEGASQPGEPVVNGQFQATLAGYQTLINYLTRFFPVPPEEINKNIAFLKEVGEDRGNDIGFDVKIDGGKVTVNGKTEEQVMEIKNKYYPPVDLNAMSDRGMSMDGAVPSAAPNAPEAMPSPTIPTQPAPLDPLQAPAATPTAPVTPGVAPAPVEGTKSIQ